MKTRNIFILIITILLGISCNKKTIYYGGSGYLKDSTLSSKQGLLLDSTKYYLPSKYYNDTNWIDANIDTFCLKWYSSNLTCFKVPILYNYYLGHDVFRFLWIRSFHRPVLITLEHKDKITLNTKILVTQPKFLTIIYNPYGNTKNDNNLYIWTSMDMQTASKEYPDADSIVLPKSDVKIALDTTYILTTQQWNNFVTLVDSCKFWELEPLKRELGLDGAEWILEAQQSEKYHYVVRWSPADTYRRCCVYLIKLSAAKDEEIY